MTDQSLSERGSIGPNATDIDVDVAIVGAGPAGAATALALLALAPERAGRVVMVEKAAHPRPKLCGGGLTYLGERVLRQLGLDVEAADIEHWAAREIRFRYGGHTTRFFANPVLRVFDRASFDAWLAREAVARGARLLEREAVQAIEVNDEGVRLQTDQRVLRAQVLVAADGSKSTVRRLLRWPGERCVARLLEVLTPEDASQEPLFEEEAALFDWAPTERGLQGYYWDFPSLRNGRAVMNRGVFDACASERAPRGPARPLEGQGIKGVLVEELDRRQRSLEACELKGHPIRWFDFSAPLSRPRVLLAGDAAGVDPLFGEGISFALAYGRVAAAAVARGLKNGRFGFGGYRRAVLTAPLLWQLTWRVPIARLLYRRRSDALLRGLMAVGRVFSFVVGRLPFFGLGRGNVRHGSGPP